MRFSEHGKEYGYAPSSLDLLDPAQPSPPSFRVYRLEKPCYRCGKSTSVYTYIKFDDGSNEDLVFPWDKPRLLEHQDLFAHLQDPSIEYYGLKVIGEDEALDRLLMEQFPQKIQPRYSKVQKRTYPMNLCDHCGAIQGWNYIYRQVNELVADMREIELVTC